VKPSRARARPVRSGGPLSLLALLPCALQDEDFSTRSSIVREPQEVRHLFEDADRAGQAGEYAAAVALLQGAIERHAEDLFAVEPEGTYRGAACEATRRIGELPPEGRAAYEAAFGAVASRALEEALDRRDEKALRDLAARHFHTRAGARATLLLGDLAFERGDFAAAARAYDALRSRADRQDDPDLRLRLCAIAVLRGDRDALDRLGAGEAGEGEIGGERTEVARFLERTPPPREPARPLSPPTSTATLREPAWSFFLPPPRDSPAQRYALPFSKTIGRQQDAPRPFNLFPAVQGGSVFVTDSIRLFALDLLSGILRWEFSGTEEWKQAPVDADAFRDALSPSTVVAPCVDRGVVVAALQVPLRRAADGKDDFHHIPIRYILPARRLFGFDAATGALLWTHWSPTAATLDVGSFHERSTVAAPPVTDGERVYTLSVLYGGKIDLYACAYDLRTGAPVWRTPLVFGQIQQNMFGRFLVEYAGTPPLLSDGALFVATNLEVVARLDAPTGRIEWLSRYESLRLKRPQGYSDPERKPFFANRTPVLDGEMLYTTPLDSRYLIGFEARTGVERWKESVGTLAPRDSEGHLSLVGVADRRLYLLGESLHGYRVAGEPTDENLRLEFDSGRAPLLHPKEASRIPAAVLAGDHLFVPAEEGPRVFDRLSGKRVTFARELTWPSPAHDEMGNFTATDGVLLSTTPDSVHAYFDWDELLAAVRARSPNSPRLAELLRRRGEVLLTSGNGEGALQALREAERILTGPPPESAPSGTVGTGRALSSAEARSAFYRLELALAEAGERKGDAEAERGALRRAAENAPTKEERLQALLRLDASFLKRTSAAERSEEEALLDRLAREFGDEEREFPGKGRIPVGLHAWIRKGDRAEEAGDLKAAVEAMRRIAARYAKVDLEGRTAGTYARGRLLSLLAGAPPEFRVPFEAEAESRLGALRGSPDPGALEAVARDYPGTGAAREAAIAGIDASLARGEEEPALRGTVGLLSTNPDPPFEARAARRLAAIARLLGNEPLERASLRRTARLAPESASDYAPDGGLRFRDLEPPPNPEPPRPEGPGVDPTYLETARYGRSSSPPGSFFPVGGESPRAEGYLFVRVGDELLAYEPERSGIARPLWTRSFGGEGAGDLLDRGIYVRGRLLVAEGARLRGLDADTGADAFEPRPLPSPPASPSRFVWGEGVAVVSCVGSGKNLLLAFETARGHALWSRPVPGPFAPGLLVGEGELVFIVPEGPKGRAHRIDLATGSSRGEFEIAEAIERSDPARNAALVPGWLLLANLASKVSAGPAILAYSLADGTRRPIPAPPETSLEAILLTRGEPLAVFGRSRDAAAGARGLVARILPESGATAPFFDLPAGAVLLGVTSSEADAQALRRAESPFPPVLPVEEEGVLVVSREGSGMARLSLHDLSKGLPLWRKSGTPSPLGTAPLARPPVPVLGAHVLALLEARAEPPSIAFLSRADGSRLGTLELKRGLANRAVEMASIGRTLLVRDGLELRLIGSRP
jgi:outer membrane protein assembly factor BamB